MLARWFIPVLGGLILGFFSINAFADIISDSSKPRILEVGVTYPFVSNIESKLLRANEGEAVALSRVSGNKEGFFLYSTKYLLPSGTIPENKGLFLYCCVKYTGAENFTIDPTNTYGYLCVKKAGSESLVPVGYVYQSNGGDSIYPSRVESLCTDDDYFRGRFDYEGHLTNSVCDISFQSGIARLRLK